MIYPVGYQSVLYPSYRSDAMGQAVNAVNKVNGVNAVQKKDSPITGKVEASQCQTCKSRKYVDQSNESVSYKSPTHISPQQSFAAVAAHEQEHVANAVKEGKQAGKELVSASVSLQMDICPECGTPYVAGGVTTTQIKYNECNPYDSYRKSIEGNLLKGMYVNYVA